MREARYVSLIPRATLHSDSEHEMSLLQVMAGILPQCKKTDQDLSFSFPGYFLQNAVFLIVRYHCGGWSEEVNSCILIISYMVYL